MTVFAMQLPMVQYLPPHHRSANDRICHAASNGSISTPTSPEVLMTVFAM